MFDDQLAATRPDGAFPDPAWALGAGPARVISVLDPPREALPWGGEAWWDGVDAGSSVDARAPLAEWLPGVDMVVALERLDVDDLDDYDVVEAVAAWRRVGAWAAARAAQAAAALARRASMNSPWPEAAGTVAEPNVAGDELALRLGCTRSGARALVRAGLAFEGALWPTGEALATGRIDEPKATLLVAALDDVPEQLACQVQAAVLPHADRQTRRQLAADVERALIAIDPETADLRAAAATAGRRVSRPQVRPDGMVGLWAVLPAPAGLALSSGLDAIARRAREAGDGRTVEQLRADVLCAAVLNVGRDSRGHGAPSGRPPDEDAAALVEWIVGTPLLTELRVTVPLDLLAGDVAPGREPPTPRDALEPVGDPTPTDVLDPPAELAGYGAIAPSVARALARDGTWRRLVTDPLSGALLDVGRTRYRPPADLDEFVRLRDGTCVRPGCSVPAHACDLDHTVPYDADDDGPSRARAHVSAALGTTAHGNLGALCRTDHRIKTHAGFALAQVAPGVFEWTTPTGHRYDHVSRPPGAPVVTEAVDPPIGRTPGPPRPPGGRAPVLPLPPGGDPPGRAAGPDGTRDAAPPF